MSLLIRLELKNSATIHPGGFWVAGKRLLHISLSSWAGDWLCLGWRHDDNGAFWLTLGWIATGVFLDTAFVVFESYSNR